MYEILLHIKHVSRDTNVLRVTKLRDVLSEYP